VKTISVPIENDSEQQVDISLVTQHWFVIMKLHLSPELQLCIVLRN